VNQKVMTPLKVAQQMTSRDQDSPTGKKSLLKSKLSIGATTQKTANFLQLTQKNSSLNHLKQAGHGDAVSLAIEYGEMLPKTGIYSLPDFKVILFLKVLTDYHRKLEKE